MDVEIVLPRVDGTEHRLAVDTRTALLDACRRAADANIVPAIRDAAGAARR